MGLILTLSRVVIYVEPIFVHGFIHMYLLIDD